jgi:DNA helicase-2/ATP-dependent DNA helicase PcrA
MSHAYELFKDAEVSSRWRDTFRYINVDEMQDTSLVEYKIISKLFGENRLLLCGDYFQTIYEWRGSRPETVQQQFIRDYKPKIIVFYENYRATRLLLNASYDYLRGLFPAEVEKIYPESVRAASTIAGEPIHLHGSYDVDDEARWIYNNIQSLGVTDWSRVCILTRNNYHNEELAKAFADLKLI